MASNQNLVVSLGRQVGSGGYFVGKMLAEQMGLTFYDKELLFRAAKESGLSAQIFEQSDEKAVQGWAKLLTPSDFYGGSFFDPKSAMLSRESIFSIQSAVIRKISEEKPCLFIGRCSDYILRDNPNLRSIFIHAPLEMRIKTVAERMHIPEREAESFIAKEEKKRAAYYNYFTGKSWGSASSYHFTLDAGLLGLEGCTKALRSLLAL